MGWYLDESGATPVDSEYLTKDTTLYAKVLAITQAENSYTVNFAYGDGVEENFVTLSASKSYPKDYDLTLLPEPEVTAGIFLGWYQDSACTTEATGTLSQNTTVYAHVQELGAAAVYTPHFLSVEETGINYSFQVWGNSEAEIYQALQLIDATAENAETHYTLSYISDNIYTVQISGYQDGEESISANTYTEGHIYKASLPADSSVCFVSSSGDVQDTSVRELNFSIAKANVQNVQLNQGMIYIPNSDVSNFTGDTGNGLMGIDVSNGSVTETLEAGVFTYTKNPLSLGDTVAIYEGAHPGQRTVADAITESQEDWIVYGTITNVGANGNYAYLTPDSKEVLFTPDVLPLSATADLVSGDGAVFTVLESQLDFTDYDLDGDSLGLDGDTTVDVGDFLAIYQEATAELAMMSRSSVSYGRIDTVSLEDVSGDSCYILHYTIVSQEEMMEAMDLHTEAVDQDMSLTTEEQQELEEEIAQEALNSGFAEIVAHSIGETLLDDEGYENLAHLTGLDQLEAHTTLKTLSVSAPEGYTLETLAVGAGVSAKVKNITASAVVYAGYLTNLAGQGRSVELSVGFDYEIDCGNGLKVVLEVEAIFVQEVEFSVSVSGGAVWKWKWIFPYISDYRLNTSINVGTYTGIGLVGSIQLKEESNFLQDSFDFLQGTGNETGAEKLASIADTVGTLIDAGNFFNLDDSAKKDLENEYSELLDSYSGDWVDVYTKNIVAQRGFVPGTLCVLAYGVDIDFVVAVRASVQLGMSFEYSNAKSYIFSISLFGKSATSETIDRITSNYMFNFYTIGTIGVRAGVRLTVRVGLLHVDLLSMGIQAEVGGYCQVWGYFYYRYAWESGKGATSYKGGAFYLDMGLYLDINFCASAVGLNASVPLYSKEWPLFSIGEYLVSIDFTTAEEGFENLAYFGSKTLTLPSYAQKMQTQNLKTGDLGSKDVDWNDFTMKFSNSLFTWNKTSKKIIVNPAPGQIEASTEMTITYDNALDLNGPISRTFEIFWNDPNNANIYNFDSNGGTYIPVMTTGFSVPISAPESPTKTGYTFAGWYLDQALTQSYTFPSISVSNKVADVFLYAKWSPAPSPYTVEYYQQNLYGRYELAYTEIINSDRSNWNILAEGSANHHNVSAPSGFTYMSSLSNHSHDSIQGIGSLVVQEYYSRNQYTITYTAPETGYAPLVYTYLYGYTTVIPSSLFYYAGYQFEGWYTSDMVLTGEETLVMPAKDMTFTATWAVGDSYYQVEHYLQDQSGSYALGEMTQTIYDEDTGETYEYIGNAVEYHWGKTGESVADLSSLQGVFTGYNYSKATGNGASLSNTLPRISGDNSTLIRLFYDRNMITVHWNSDGGTEIDASSFIEGGKITLPATPSKTGYVFVEWQDENGVALVAGSTVGSETVTYKAIWSAGEGTAYNVKHVRQNVDGSYPTSGQLIEQDTFYGNTNDSVSPSVKTYEGFSSPTVTTHNIFPDGSLLVVYQYSRNTYQINYDLTGGDPMLNAVNSYLYGKGTTNLPVASKLGYLFSHWTHNGTQISSISTADIGDMSLVAVWEPDGNTVYQVEHYTENLYGGYSLDRTTEHKGETESSVTAAQDNITGFTFDGTNGSNLTTGTILPDGSLMLKLYYSRNSYQVAWYDYDGITELTTQTYNYEEAIFAPNITPSRDGHSFGIWQNYATEMGSSDLSYNGKDHGTWTANSYSLSYDLAGGMLSADAPTSYVYGEGTALHAPTRAGYTFQYWTVSGTQVTEITTTDFGDIHLVANWAVLGDTAYTTEHYTENLDGSFLLAKTSSLTGATDDTATAIQENFRGFTYDGTIAGTVATGAITGTGDLVLKLYYSRNSYTVHWYDCSGASLESVSYLYEAPITITEKVPSKIGYTFEEWNADDIASTMGAENLSYDANTNAKWREATYSITYNLQDDERLYTTPDDNWHIYGRVTVLPTPSKLGYIFVSWTDGVNNFTSLIETDYGDKVLTANWIPEDATTYVIIHYHKDLGKDTYTKKESQYNSGTTGTTVTANPIEYTGFTFDPTHPDTTLSGQIQGDSSLTLKLYYVRNLQTLTWYDFDKTTVLGTSEHEYMDEITEIPEAIKSPTRTGWRFLGWHTPLYLYWIGDSVNASNNGSWEWNTYTITFDENGGDGTMSDFPVDYGERYNLPTNTFTRSSYTFAGWSTTADGAVEYADTAWVENLTAEHEATFTLYAVWTADGYTISYDMGGKGTVDSTLFPTSYTVESGDITLRTSDISVNSGQTFSGWTASSGSITASGEDYIFTPDENGGNVTLTALWQAYFQVTLNRTGTAQENFDVIPGEEFKVQATEGKYISEFKVTDSVTGAVVLTADKEDDYNYSFIMPSTSVVVTVIELDDYAT